MSTEHFSRQSFLGPDAEQRIAALRVGLVGAGGGGSHMAQQLAHVGFRQFEIFDPDAVEWSNLNRNVGSTVRDVEVSRSKADIAARMILGVQPDADLSVHPSRWQERAEVLRACDLVVGCVDGFAARRELETSCRRHLQPYVDLGLDVHHVPGEPPQLGGQVILSMPGSPCMECLGFITPERLAKEAGRYGAAGIRPQVVWGNGALAAAAVGLIVDLATGWTGEGRPWAYLSYDGNRSTIGPHPRAEFHRQTLCPHFPLTDVGPPQLRAA